LIQSASVAEGEIYISPDANLADGQHKLTIKATNNAGIAINTSVDYLGTLLTSLVGHDFDLIPHSIIANTPKFTPGTFALDQIKRYTAPYARALKKTPASLPANLLKLHLKFAPRKHLQNQNRL